MVQEFFCIFERSYHIIWTDMPKPRDFLPRTLSFRICLRTVISVGSLLVATILAMTIGTRLIIREETAGNMDQALEVFDPGFRISIAMIILGVILIAAGAIAIARISMKPLRKLTYTTLDIAQGNYSLPFGETKRTDDVGRLRNHYVKMQETVSAHMEQLKSLSQSEESRQQVLAETYAKTKEIEKLKSAFFSSMTHQLADEVAQIQGGADKLYESGGDIDNEEMRQVLKDIERDGVRVTEILNDMLNSNN